MMTSFLSSAQEEELERDFVSISNKPDFLLTCVNSILRQNKIKPFPLSDVKDLKVQQGLIIKDLLFAFLGYEGFYIRYSDKYDPNNVYAKIRGPDFKIAKHLDVSLKSIAKKLVKYGKYYSGLNGFIELYNRPTSGRLVQRFCSCLILFIEKYHQVICALEEEFKYNSSFNLNYLENILYQEVSLGLGHLYEILTTIHNDTMERQRNKAQYNEMNFTNFMRSIENDLKQTGSIDLSTDIARFEVCKGSLILKIVEDRIKTYLGDGPSHEFLLYLFDNISTDYVSMMNKWLIEGEIDDPFEEFLIKQNEHASQGFDIQKINIEKYWDELYMIRPEGVIDQISKKDLQLKILTTGKFLTIFKKCLKINDFSGFDDNIDPIEKLYSQDLEYKIEELYKRANKLMMKLLFEGYDLTYLLMYLQFRFLSNDAYKLDSFLDKSFIDLKKNKHSISLSRLRNSYNSIFNIEDNSDFLVLGQTGSTRTNVESIINKSIEISIDVTNFYDLAKEILNVTSIDAEEALRNSNPNAFKALLNKSVERQITSATSHTSQDAYDPDHSDEYTIAGIQLNIKLPFPYNMIINQTCMFEYQLLFKLSTLVRFVSKLLDHTWKEINCSTVWRYGGYDASIKKWILRCRVLHNRMKDFINQFLFYLTYDVTESNYKILMDQVLEVKKELETKDLSTCIKNKASGLEGIFGTRKGGIGNFSYNNVFDEKILSRNQKLNQSKTKHETSFEAIVHSLETFLNNILRDSLLTNKLTVDVLKNMLDAIILYNNYLSRLKKSLILLNNDLFEKFRSDYPEKFEGKVVNEEEIKKRFRNLNEMLNAHFQIFSDSLNELIMTLRSLGNQESLLFLILLERLEVCFPTN